MVADLERRARHRRHGIEAAIIGEVEQHRRSLPRGAVLRRRLQQHQHLPGGHHPRCQRRRHQARRPWPGGHDQQIGAAIPAMVQAQGRALGVHHGGAPALDHDSGLRQVPREPLDNSPRQQRAAGLHMEGGTDAGLGEDREARRDIGGGQVVQGMAIRQQRRAAVTQPTIAPARDGEHPGALVQHLADIPPHLLPGGIGGVHHAHVAGLRAVGMADQPMVVDRGAARVRHLVLVQDAHREAAPRQSPGGGQPHDAGAEHQCGGGGSHGPILCLAFRQV